MMIPLFKVSMSPTVGPAVQEVLNSGFIGQGKKVDEFEEILKDWIGNQYTLTTNNATSAEHLALHLMKKQNKAKDGDEILCTPLTCTATNWPVLANNLKIKWVDIDPRNLNMDLDDLARKITPKTKGIMLVHWGGYPVDLKRLDEILNNTENMYGFRPFVIEDCAHSFGSTFLGKKMGNHGNICTYSFQAIKTLTCGDGGALVLQDQDSYDNCKLMRWYGIDREDNSKDFRCEKDIENWGFKFHMNDINATIGIENTKITDSVISRHKDNAKYYDKNLKNISGITLTERDSRMDSSFWIYSMLVEDRDGFMKKMKECEIMVSQVHERNDKHSCVREFRSQLPNLESVIPNLISIPVGFWVKNYDREYVVEKIREGW